MLEVEPAHLDRGAVDGGVAAIHPDGEFGQQGVDFVLLEEALWVLLRRVGPQFGGAYPREEVAADRFDLARDVLPGDLIFPEHLYQADLERLGRRRERFGVDGVGGVPVVVLAGRDLVVDFERQATIRPRIMFESLVVAIAEVEADGPLRG